MPEQTLFRRSRIATLAAVPLFIAACSNAGGGPTTAPTTAATQAPTTTSATQTAAEAIEIELADKDTVGKYLVDADGKTLYLFMSDSADKSACNGDCAGSWPPLVLAAGETVQGGEGVTGTFTTITRDDGSTQVAYAGHPLYHFSGDQAAGDTNGQGLFSKWYLVGADGNAIMGPTSTGGRYGY